MSHDLQFYIDGEWMDPISRSTLPVIDPSTEEPFRVIAIGSEADVDRAVAAAKAAFPAYAATSCRERIALLNRVLEAYQARYDEIAETISREIGAPVSLAYKQHAAKGTMHITRMIEVLESFRFEEVLGTTRIAREPIGVVGMITPWNWPINQIICKVAPALAAGCTMVLKPSEIAPLNALLLAEVMHEAGVPRGVFNLVNGDGPTVGQAIARHPDIDMVSFTGSTRAGIQVAQTAADTVKRVHQELGGKSANIIFDDVDLDRAVKLGIQGCFRNTGQSCNAPSRMLVPSDMQDDVIAIAQEAVETYHVGSPSSLETVLGPVATEAQYEKVQRLIETGIKEGADLVAGGPGRPENLNRGYYVRPTVFANVTPKMTLAQEEIFGPVLSILPFESEAEAIEIANDTPYGLAAYVQSADLNRAQRVAAKMRAGSVYINYPPWDGMAPFGGFKRSGNGREYGPYGLQSYLELKSMVGYQVAS